VKGRTPLLESASDERTCDGTETSFPQSFPLKTENATSERRQEGQDEGDGRTLVDLLTLDAGAAGDLDRLADELRRRLTPSERRRLAELLTSGG